MRRLKQSVGQIRFCFTSERRFDHEKVILLLIIAFFLAGCSAEFYKHDTVYKTNDHMTFSWWGYKTPTDEDLKMSESEGWWGEEIPYIPAE
jgi:hypothetical protein